MSTDGAELESGREIEIVYRSLHSPDVLKSLAAERGLEVRKTYEGFCVLGGPVHTVILAIIDIKRPAFSFVGCPVQRSGSAVAVSIISDLRNLVSSV